jgi:hypothetical protein
MELAHGDDQHGDARTVTGFNAPCSCCASEGLRSATARVSSCGLAVSPDCEVNPCDAKFL